MKISSCKNEAFVDFQTFFRIRSINETVVVNKLNAVTKVWSSYISEVWRNSIVYFDMDIIREQLNEKIKK